jgi:hypothetical protein
MKSTILWNVILHSSYSVLLFDPEDGGSMFLQNVYRLQLDYMALHSKKQYVHIHHRENLKLRGFNNLTCHTMH